MLCLEMGGSHMTRAMLIEMLWLGLAVAFTITTATEKPNQNTSYSPHVSALHQPRMGGRFPGVKDRMLLHGGDEDVFEKRDVKALLSFRSGITADPMQSLSVWTSANSEKVCSWNGVWCRKNTHRVVAIILPQLGLEGTISASIGGLSLLHTLNLSVNSFTGRIPPQLGQLKALRVLDLNTNLLMGSIPKSLANCTHLQWIRLSVNNLAGSIPEEFGGLGNLQHLRLSYNRLGGSIPISLGNCTSLLDLVLGSNNLTGVLPEGITNLSKLENLTVNVNHLTGEIPKGIGELQSLNALYLHSNNLSGPIPPSIGKLTNLTQLYIFQNKISGSIPDSIGNLVSLQNFDASDNLLTGKIPQSIGNCKSITDLVLSDNNLTGRIPATVSNCTALRRHSNSFYGDLHIYFSSSTEVLSGHSNKFSGILPASLVNCTHLKLLDFSRNQLTGEFPSGLLANCQELRVLSLGFNELEGIIPLWITNLTSLQVLDLSNNKFSGRIPTPLKGLEGFRNSESSPIPSNTLYEDMPIVMKGFEYKITYVLTANTILDLSYNNLIGHIPESIGNLSSMRLLNLSGNQLGGQIPTSLGQISTLEQLDLSRNNLRGHIPEELSNLFHLAYFNVSFNNLCGHIPGGPQFVTFDERSYQGNPPCLCTNRFNVNKCKKNVPIVLPSEKGEKSVWSRIDESVSVIAVGVGLVIGFGGTMSMIVWGQSLGRWIRALKRRGFYGVADSQSCSWSLNYSPRFSFHPSTSASAG